MSETAVIEWRMQGQLSGQELEDALNDALVALQGDPEVLRELNVTASEVAGLRFTVEETAGFDFGAIILAIALGMLTNAAWDGTKVLYRYAVDRVQKKHGLDAIGDPSPPEG